MLTDTHCHINMMIKQTFDTPLSNDEYAHAKQIVQEATAAGVTQLITVGTSVVESINCINLAERFPGVYAAVGMHPHDCTETWHNNLQEIKKLLHNPRVVAIGECGLDFHYPGYHPQWQKDAFRAQIELALTHNLALIVHTRDAWDETMRILEEFQGSLSRVVMHCFSENLAAAEQVIAMGFLIGIAGSVTYPKNNTLRTVVSTVGLSHIILETDAPFLPPQIIRGQQNHPKYIAEIADYLAQYMQLPYETIAQQTTANAHRLFNIKITEQ